MSKFTTFYDWLAKQKNRHSPLGDVASDALRDASFPRDLASEDALLTYLREKQAPGAKLAAARLAWRTYAREQK